MSQMIRRAALLGIAAIVAVGVILGVAGPAEAHNYLTSSTPEVDGTLTTLPTEFEVTTNGLLLNIDGNSDGFALQIQDAKGLYYGDGCVKVDGSSITANAAVGAPGSYTITWQVISTDGHTVSNTYPFRWQPPAGSTEKSFAGTKKAPDCHGTLKPNVTVASSDASAARSASLSTVLWIGGAVVLVGIAVVVTILVAGRKKKPSAE